MPKPSEMILEEDSVLIAQCLAGQADAFGRIIHKYQTAVMNVAMRVLTNSQEAEDVTQQVFIEAYRHLVDFRGDSQLFTWLYSITLNRCRNQIRSRKRRQTVSLDAPVGDDDSIRLGFRLADPVQRHDKQLESRLASDWVKRRAVALSPDFREIFDLYYFQEMPLPQIAKQLGRPLNTVKVYLHRARKELYELWEKENPGDARP